MPAGVLFGLVAISSTAVLALLLSLWLLKTVRKLKRELRQLQNTATVQREPEPRASFSASLNRAERTERATVPAAPRVIPQADRYQYIEALAAQGLDAGKIAAALQMAAAEVEQLLQLARLKQNVAARR